MSALARSPQASAPATTSKAMSAAGLRAFFNIAGSWGLNTDEQMVLLGAPGRSTYFKWKSAPESADLKRDTLERLSYILGVYKALQILLPDTTAADAWVKKPNTAPLFGGNSALDRMLGGNMGDLLAVRQYLDARRGGWA
ncbi:MAG: MbcA/ParS/Xre antitoxin family protein [Pseudomonadota bacterium]|nr:MbcA/ParS/Xre antitoxin family protein [Pseudomonadota bacterium]